MIFPSFEGGKHLCIILVNTICLRNMYPFVTFPIFFSNYWNKVDPNLVIVDHKVQRNELQLHKVSYFVCHVLTLFMPICWHFVSCSGCHVKILVHV